MFHIPISLRHVVSTERFSVPGYPCLYLASQAELCWYECGKPEQFTICKMDIPQEVDNHLHLIDFSQKIYPLMHDFFIWFHNSKDDIEELKRVRRYFIKTILSMPLRAACSVEVKYKNGVFKEEYIIPQLLLQWVRETDEFDGIKYLSAVSVDGEVNYWGGHDIVLPSKKFRRDGLCENLTKLVKVATPVRYDLDSITVDSALKDCVKNVKEEPAYWNMDSIPSDFELLTE